MSAWRLAKSLEQLRDEVNATWPTRDKASDGTIGDPAHAGTGSASDHNPWVIDENGVGVVRAFDIDSDLDGNGVDSASQLAEHFRQLGAAGDNRLINGGYVIWSGHIASENGSWWWRTYNGADPHTSHIHLSVSRTGYDTPGSWGVATQGDDDMTDAQAETLEYIRNTADTHTKRLDEHAAALDQIKADLAKLLADK